MATAFRPDPKRDAAAEQIAEGATCWPIVTLKRDVNAFKAGEVFFGVPSSAGTGSRYLTNARFCSCKDYERRGQGCKHQRAVIRFLAERPALTAKGQRIADLLARRAEIIELMDERQAELPPHCDTRYDPLVGELWALRCSVEDQIEQAAGS